MRTFFVPLRDPTGVADPINSVSSDLRPGGPLQSTERVPVNVVPGGFHTSDLVTENGVVNAGCRAVIDAEVAQLVEWVSEYPGGKKGGHPWQA